jgi:hypothetical protein
MERMPPWLLLSFGALLGALLGAALFGAGMWVGSH